MSIKNLMIVVLIMAMLLTAGCVVSPLQMTAENTIAKGFANSSINVSVFRQSALLEVGQGYVIGFYRSDGIPVVQLRDNQDKLLSELLLPEITGYLLNNGHPSISLGLAPSGDIHLLYGAHVTVPVYAKIKVNGGELQLLEQRSWDAKMTYPQFYNMAGKLMLISRCLPHSCYQILTESGWTEPKKFLDAMGYVVIYLDKLGVDGDKATASWVYRGKSPVRGLVTNMGTYWANFRVVEDNVEWQQLANGEFDVHYVRDVPASIINQGSGYRDGKFYYIASQMGDADGVPNIHLLRVNSDNGVSDCRVQVSDNKRQAPLIGLGTLSLPVSRAEVAVSEQYVHMIYRQQHSLVIASTKKEKVCEGKWRYWRQEIADFDGWEPSYDDIAWRNKRIIRMMVQSTRQGDSDTGIDGEPSDIVMMSWKEVEQKGLIGMLLRKRSQ